MGGFGSGRTGGRPCTDEQRQLDIRTLKRKGYMAPGLHALRWLQGGTVVAAVDLVVERYRVTLAYSVREPGEDEWRPMRYAIELARTPCTFGGERLWWRCPAVGCGRRVAVLYGGAVFACRHCYGLAYKSQREDASDRAIRKAEKIRERLGWGAGIMTPPAGKPPGMHWRTFERLSREHDALADGALQLALERLSLR